MTATIHTLHPQHRADDDSHTLHEAQAGVRAQIDGINEAYRSGDLDQMRTELVGLTYWADELRKLNAKVFALSATILTHQHNAGKLTDDEYQGELVVLLAQANGTGA